MDKTREEILAEQERVIAIQAKADEILFKIPGVVGTAVGVKEVRGIEQDETVIRVYVKKKKSINEVSQDEMIPPIILGVKTDVIELGDVQLEVDTKEYRPICGGIQIMTENWPSELKKQDLGGTLGCLVIDNTDNSIAILTNRHVLTQFGESPNDLVGQPSAPCDSCCSECCFIAKIVRATPATDTQVDGAIAHLTNGAEHNYINEILEIGPVFGHNTLVARGDTIRKRGRTTGLTEGRVTAVNKSFTMNGVTYVNQIEVTPNPPHTRMSQNGDSGSVYVNNLNQIVALHFSGNGTTANGNQIANVLSKLNITIPSVGTLESIPLKSNSTNPSPKNTDLKKVIEWAESYEFGDTFVQLIKKHRIEVMSLINENRAVKVAWNRFKGPVFMAHLMEKGKVQAYQIPDNVDGVSPQLLLLKMSTVLEIYGSPELATDIETHSVNVIQLFHILINEQCAVVI